MSNLIDWKYNLETLEIWKLSLNMIKDFSSEMESRRKELYNLSINNSASFTQELRVEYATLEFLKSADFYRDEVLKDWKIDEKEKPLVDKALQALARAEKLKNWIDSY